MNIILDCREKALIELFKKEHNDLKMESTAIPLGDILIRKESGEDMMLFERKTINDLLSSIADGRYEEQSYRLQQCDLPNHHIYYIIEGDIENYKPRNSASSLYNKKTVYSCLYSLTYLKGFSILCSKSLSETAEIIAKFSRKLVSDPPSSQEKTYLDSVKISKKGNMSDEVVGALMLAQIPSVSKNVASVILKTFKNVNGLVKALENDANCLDNYKYDIANNKQRKLSKPCVANLKKYLLNVEYEN
jgi:ERCC4-type nuclease